MLFKPAYNTFDIKLEKWFMVLTNSYPTFTALHTFSLYLKPLQLAFDIDHCLHT